MPDWWERALDVVFPPRCAGCGARGYLLCPECTATIAYIRPPACPMCGRRTTRPGICPICRAYPNALDGMVAATAFEEPVRACIHALKYEGQRPYAGLLAELARPSLALLPPPDAIVPVPLFAKRERGRGFNQSALIARRLAGDDLPVLPQWLARTRDTPPQVGQDREARHANVADAFICPDPATVRGRSIVLLDDVATTGATLDACASALRAAGALSVHALVVARAE
jgi:ComF family protein